MAAREKVEPVSLKDEVRNLLEEARMVLPGIQALFGFQLIAVFNQRFEEMEQPAQLIHLAAMLLVALAVVLIMTPAAYHRIAVRGELSRRFVDLSSALIATAMVPFALGVSLDIFVITHLMLHSVAVGAVIAAAALALFIGFWFVFPFSARRSRSHFK